nr:flavodoxin [uncultured Anaeromusa sp.]
MKKNKVAFSLTVVLVLLVMAGMQTLSAMDMIQSFRQASPTTEKMPDETIRGRKVLVVYYSRSGQTREIAKQLQVQTGGDLLEIETVEPYPQDYAAVVQQSKQEIEANYKPDLKTKAENIASYDMIFVGSPIWWGTIAPPVVSFLVGNDFSGKTIVPFVTHAGSGVAQSVEDIKKLCPQAQVLNGLAIEGNKSKAVNEEIAQWLSRLQTIE